MPSITRTNAIRSLKIASAAIVVILIISFAIWGSLDYARGPTIVISEPVNGVTISSPSVDVVGRAQRISFISLNGKAISVDESGQFKETIIVFPGVNILTLLAHDQFGRSVQRSIEIFGALPFSNTEQATSTSS